MMTMIVPEDEDDDDVASSHHPLHKYTYYNVVKIKSVQIRRISRDKMDWLDKLADQFRDNTGSRTFILHPDFRTV
jgi:hypothetical protein